MSPVKDKREDLESYVTSGHNAFWNVFKYFWKLVIDYTRLVINYQQLKLFITAIRNLNSIFKACNRLHKAYNRLPKGIFENNSQESHLFKSFLNGFQRIINRWLGIRNSSELCLHKESYPLKNKIVLSSKTFLGQNTCKFNKESLSDLHCIIFLLKERILLLPFLIQENWLRDRGSLVVRLSEHKGRVVLMWFRHCKRNFTR